jgi:hypothetical protein
MTSISTAFIVKFCNTPIEHVWDFIGRKTNQRNPKCQNIDELRTAILQECQQFPQERLRRPERRDYDVAKMGFKTGAGKT